MWRWISFVCHCLIDYLFILIQIFLSSHQYKIAFVLMKHISQCFISIKLFHTLLLYIELINLRNNQFNFQTFEAFNFTLKKCPLKTASTRELHQKTINYYLLLRLKAWIVLNNSPSIMNKLTNYRKLQYCKHSSISR